MKEFIEKLIGRLLLESSGCKVYKLIYPNKEDIAEFNAYKKCIEIVNKLAEEYENDFCEWKVDGVYLMCQHKTELFISCLEDEKYRYKHCPICGKKIKAVE